MTDALRTAFAEQLESGSPPSFDTVRRRFRRRQRATVLSAALAVSLIAGVPVGLSRLLDPSPSQEPMTTLAAAPAADEAARVGDAVRRLSSYDPRALAPYAAAVDELSAGQARADPDGRLRDLRGDTQRWTRTAPGFLTAGLVTRSATTSTWLVLLDDTQVPRRAEVDDRSGRVVLLGEPVDSDLKGLSSLPATAQGRRIAELLAPTLATGG